jgi:hypothetical protein
MERKAATRAKHNCSENFSDPSPSVPAATEKRRPGAPKGNKNALKHGARTREMDAFRAEVREHLRESRARIKRVKALMAQRHELAR